jgi:pentatricopeptide repeat protein
MAVVYVSAEEIARNRAIFLYHLRVNPDNVQQITGALKAGFKMMCATGLGCDALNIPMTSWEIEKAGHVGDGFSPYQALADKLGISKSAVVKMYGLNDVYHCTFSEVAKVADAYFRSGQTESVLGVYNKLKEEGVINGQL